MRRISTGVDQLLTTDGVADATLAYAAVLARAGTADTVTIPIVGEDGRPETARLLLGPASQLSVVPDEGRTVPHLPGVAEVIEDLERRGRRLEPAPVEPIDLAVSEVFPDLDGSR